MATKKAADAAAGEETAKNILQINGEPPMSGPGVSPIKIKAIDKAAREYIPAKDARVAASRDEVAAKQKLLDLIHKYRAEIGVDKDGVCRYRFADKIIVLEPTDENSRSRMRTRKGRRNKLWQLNA